MEELSIDEMRAEVNEHGVLDIDQAEELLDRLEQAEAIISQLTPTHLKMIREALDGDTHG